MEEQNSKGVAVNAATEHLLSGKPLTRLEAIVLYGLSNLPELIYELKKKHKFKIEKKQVAYAMAMVRVNKHATLKPPANLPVREIMLTEYWIAR